MTFVPSLFCQNENKWLCSDDSNTHRMVRFGTSATDAGILPVSWLLSRSLVREINRESNNCVDMWEEKNETGRWKLTYESVPFLSWKVFRGLDQTADSGLNDCEEHIPKIVRAYRSKYSSWFPTI